MKETAGNIGEEYTSALTCFYPPCFYLPHFYSLHYNSLRFYPSRLTYCCVNARGVNVNARGKHPAPKDQQSGSFDSRYKFSAKEKDDETQYSYFGARYYDSDLSVWLSVDPMSDDYPNQSPYMYCSGSPVMRIDPNGMWDTDYGITNDGKLMQIGPTNDEPDRLYAVNDDGTKKSENHVEVAKGSISNIDNKLIGVYIDQNPDTKQETLNPAYGIFVKGDDNAEKIFGFIAENVDVEFSRTAVGDATGEKGLNVISTSNKLHSEGGSQAIINFCIANSIQIRALDHNHPSNNPNPSGMDGDRGVAAFIEKHYPNAVLRIYTRSDHQFHNYNSFGPTLPTFVVD